MYQMMNLNGPNTIKPAAHKNPILKSYFRVFLDFFKRNERQGGGKRTFNVTFAAPYKESVRRTILGMKSEFKSRTRAECLTFERHSPDSVLMLYVRLPK